SDMRPDGNVVGERHGAGDDRHVVDVNALAGFRQVALELAHGHVLLPLQRKVTSSSAMVGWMATVSSKSRFVAPIFTATAKPCSISSAPGPITCRPTMRSSGPAQTSLTAALRLRSARAWCIGVNAPE